MIRREFLKLAGLMPFTGILLGKPQEPVGIQMSHFNDKEIFLGSCKVEDGLGVMVPRGSTWVLTRYEVRGNELFVWGYRRE